FVDRDLDVFELRSAGADKAFGSADDFTVLRMARPYFRSPGEAINRAVVGYHSRTEEFIRDAATLESELLLEGVDLDRLRDPWGQPYEIEFGVNQTHYSVVVRSGGPDKQFLPKDDRDDFV